MRRSGSIFGPNVLEGMEEEIDQEDAALKVCSCLVRMCMIGVPKLKLDSTHGTGGTGLAPGHARLPQTLLLFCKRLLYADWCPPSLQCQRTRHDPAVVNAADDRRTAMRRLQKRGCGCWRVSSATSIARPQRGCCLAR